MRNGITTAFSSGLPDYVPLGGLVREVDTGRLLQRAGEHAWAELARRFQLSRAKGWRMPLGGVKVDRSTKWGNQWIIEKVGGVWTVRLQRWPGRSTFPLEEQAVRFAVDQYRQSLERPGRGGLLITAEEVRAELRGKWIGCWCPIGADCHGDVLLEVANS